MNFFTESVIILSEETWRRKALCVGSIVTKATMKLEVSLFNARIDNRNQIIYKKDR